MHIQPEQVVREPFAEADLKYENNTRRISSKPKTTSQLFSKDALLPPTFVKSQKTRTVRALPVIDHKAQREKLNSIIGLIDEEPGKEK